MSPIRVVLADDHAVLREGLAALINAQHDMQVVAHAHDGQSAVAQAADWQPDVLVIDLSMPGMNGMLATEAIAGQYPQIRIVVLTRHTEPGYVRRVLQAGASAYVLKQSVATELIGAMRAVMTGATYLDATLAKQIVQEFGERVTQRSAKVDGDLSEREADVVRLIAHGYSNKEIAGQLGLSVKTVDTYKTRALEKLGLHGRAAIVRYALHQGWFATDG